jgi:hypothetical protein
LCFGDGDVCRAAPDLKRSLNSRYRATTRSASKETSGCWCQDSDLAHHDVQPELAAQHRIMVTTNRYCSPVGAGLRKDNY